HQGETDTTAFDAAATRTLHPTKALEQMRQLLGWDAGAGIADHHLGKAAVGRPPDGDGDFAREREFQGVGEQIEDHLLQPVAVDVDRLAELPANPPPAPARPV